MDAKCVSAIIKLMGCPFYPVCLNVHTHVKNFVRSLVERTIWCPGDRMKNAQNSIPPWYEFSQLTKKRVAGLSHARVKFSYSFPLSCMKHVFYNIHVVTEWKCSWHWALCAFNFLEFALKEVSICLGNVLGTYFVTFEKRYWNSDVLLIKTSIKLIDVS